MDIGWLPVFSGKRHMSEDRVKGLRLVSVPFCVSGILPPALFSLPLSSLIQPTHFSKPNSNATDFSGTFSLILFQVNDLFFLCLHVSPS